MNKIILKDLVNVIHNCAICYIEYVDENGIKHTFDWTDNLYYLDAEDKDYLEGLDQYVKEYGNKEVISIEARGYYDVSYFIRIEIR